jgi:hypothetical protein
LPWPWTAHVEHQEVWEGPSWSSTALRYDVAFFWSINPFYYSLSLDGTDKQLGQLSSSGTALPVHVAVQRQAHTVLRKRTIILVHAFMRA